LVKKHWTEFLCLYCQTIWTPNMLWYLKAVWIPLLTQGYYSVYEVCIHTWELMLRYAYEIECCQSVHMELRWGEWMTECLNPYQVVFYDHFSFTLTYIGISHSLLLYNGWCGLMTDSILCSLIFSSVLICGLFFGILFVSLKLWGALHNVWKCEIRIPSRKRSMFLRHTDGFDGQCLLCACMCVHACTLVCLCSISLNWWKSFQIY
jgi:hypothetical protein